MAPLALKHKFHGANNDFLQIINFLDVATDQLVTLGRGHAASFFSPELGGGRTVILRGNSIGLKHELWSQTACV